nr:hypothetical protein [Candidatus Bipolaricaulota bacterium]MDW8030906.1 hypothetical protein [Candidatus Bipolaricaulota bacterium]
MARLGKIALLFVLGMVALGLGSAALEGRTLTLSQMVFLGDLPYAVAYRIEIAPGYSSGGAIIYKYAGSAYLAGDLGKLAEMGYDLGRAAGRLVFGGLVPAPVLIEAAALAFVSGRVMVEGRYDLGSFGHAVQHLMLNPMQSAAHGHMFVRTVAQAINTVGDITAPISITATYEKDRITGLVQHGAQLTAELKFDKQHDSSDPKLEGSVYVRNMTLAVLSQTAWTFSGEIVAALRMDP